MLDLKINIKKSGFVLLEDGVYAATITNAAYHEHRPENYTPDWSDGTSQVKVGFKTKDGTITKSYNLVAFKTFDDLTDAEQVSGEFIMSGGTEGYALHATTKSRVADSDKADSAKAIFGNLCAVAGLDESDSVSLSSILKALSGKSLGIEVTQKKGTNTGRSYNEVTRIMESSKVSDDDGGDII